MRSLICLAIVKKACSTFEAFLAEVSRNGIPRLSANSCNDILGQRLLFSLKKASIFKEYEDGMGGTTYLCHSVFHNLLILHIAFVAYKKLVDAFSGIAVNFLKPLFYVVEGVHVSHIVYDTDSVGPAVVGRGDSSEPLLASSIPLGSPSAIK